jgi:signal transduction histidine kinase
MMKNTPPLTAVVMELLSKHHSLAGDTTDKRAAGQQKLLRILIPVSAVAATLFPLVFVYALHYAAPVSATMNLHWQSSLLYLYIIANLLIGTSALSVAWRLYHNGGKRHHIFQSLWPLIAIGCFSISNAAVHTVIKVLEWKPDYWLSLSIQYISGITAIGLAVAIPPLLPSLGRLLKSASTSDENKSLVESTNAELLKANDALRHEILERKKVEDAERTNLQRIRGIIDNLPLGAIAFDDTDRVLHANDLFCQLFELGVEAPALIGHHSTEFAGLLQKQIRNKDEFARYMQEISSSKRPHLGTEIAFRDGKVIAQDYIPLFANGGYTGQLFLYRDVTREKRIDATKSEFMSLASHQLRTPLTTMRWSFGRLNRSLTGRMTVTEERLLQEAKGAAGRMAHTIDTMLAISRVEAGKISLEVSEIKLGNTINEVRTEIREEYEQKHQSFHIDCPPGVHLQTDQFVFKEILRNLFTNAIKYTPPHGRIHIRATMLHQHVQIDVSDSGYGIPAHQQEKIFSKFFRGDNIVQRDTEGTGLGLYLVFLLVKLLGATIFFVSEEGKGTTFTLLFPRSYFPARSADSIRTI